MSRMEKNLLGDYYIDETIVDKIEYDKAKKSMIVAIKFCEWQLEELSEQGNDCKGLVFSFLNVKNVKSDLDIANFIGEFVLNIKMKSNNFKLILDNPDYNDLSFDFLTMSILEEKN